MSNILQNAVNQLKESSSLNPPEQLSEKVKKQIEMLYSTEKLSKSQIEKNDSLVNYHRQLDPSVPFKKKPLQNPKIRQDTVGKTIRKHTLSQNKTFIWKNGNLFHRKFVTKEVPLFSSKYTIEEILADPEKMLNSSFYNLKEVKELKELPVVLPDQRFEVIMRRHVQDHRGIESTVAALSKEYYWVGIKRDVKHTIKNCLFCQMNSGKKQNYEKITLVHIKTIAYRCVFFYFKSYRYNMDLSFFNGHIMFHLMCNHSRKVYGRIISAKSAKVVKDALEECILEVETDIYSILSDCGGKFKFDVEKFLRTENIEILKTLPRSPSQNGRIERFHKTLKIKLVA
jgi:hypothetical protein